MAKAVPRINARAAAVAIILAAAVGCRGPAPADLLGSRSAPEDDWYCGADAGGQWECVQDPALVANPVVKEAAAPVPVRVPSPEPPSVLDWPADHFAVQLIAVESAAAAAAFAAQLDVPGLHQVRLDSRGRLFHVLVVGAFRLRSEADAVAARLGKQLPLPEPWVRPVGTLQAAMKRAR